MKKVLIRFCILILLIVLFIPIILELYILQYIIIIISWILIGENIYEMQNRLKINYWGNYRLDYEDTYCYMPLKYLYKLLNK